MIESNAATVTPPWISQPDVDSLFHYIFSHRNLSPPFAYDVNHMAILDTISCRWIPRRALLLLFLLLFLLQSIPYGSSQITPPRPETKANDPVVIVITVMFFVVFVMVFGSIFCRRSSSPFYSRPSVFRSTDADAESRVVRIRRNTAARGLDAEAIKSFPVFVYSDVKTVRIGKGGVECAVCLSEFEDDETLRLLPPCCHVFHADCVDVWLSDHSTCPLCRADLLVLEQQQGVESYQILDPGTVSSGSDPERGVSESSDAHLLDGVTSTNSNTTPRSKSTGLSSWRITGILVPRSHSTGHSLVQPAGDLDRFTLRLPDDVRRQLMKTTGHMALPQARSSRSGYRSGSVGSERGVFSYGRKNHNYNRRLHSLSFSFSFRSGSVRSTFGGEAVAPPKNFPASIETGERSFERLRPDDRV